MSQESSPVIAQRFEKYTYVSGASKWALATEGIVIDDTALTPDSGNNVIQYPQQPLANLGLERVHNDHANNASLPQKNTCMLLGDRALQSAACAERTSTHEDQTKITEPLGVYACSSTLTESTQLQRENNDLALQSKSGIESLFTPSIEQPKPSIEPFTFLREEDRAAMEVVFLGHAGLFIKTKHATFLCDPFINWTRDPPYNGAFYGSWFPLPDNHPELSGIDLEEICNPTYLYISHFHQDHCEETFLRACVNKNTTVLLPDFSPLEDLRLKLERFGFANFQETRNNVPLEIDGLEVIIQTMMSWADGPMGDSTIYIRDLETGVSLLDQNDGRPRDLSYIRQRGCTAHFLGGSSGATYYPDRQLWSADWDTHKKLRALRGSQKNHTAWIRTGRHVDAVEATDFFPIAGPPAFLDVLSRNHVVDQLKNRIDRTALPGNTFRTPDMFVRWMRQRGYTNGHVILPGARIILAQSGCRVPEPSDEAIKNAFHSLTALERYQADVDIQQEWYEECLLLRTVNEGALLNELKRQWEPLLRIADRICEATGPNGRVRFQACDSLSSLKTSNIVDDYVIDFTERRIDWYNGEPVASTFIFPQPLLCDFIHSNSGQVTEPALDALLLAMKHLELVHTSQLEAAFAFFNALTPQRARFLNDIWGEHKDGTAVIKIGDRYYRTTNKCPLHQAPWPLMLSYDPENEELICHGHNGRWDGKTGQCLTAGADFDITLEDLGTNPGPDIQRICHHCPSLRGDLHRF